MDAKKVIHFEPAIDLASLSTCLILGNLSDAINDNYCEDHAHELDEWELETQAAIVEILERLKVEMKQGFNEIDKVIRTKISPPHA